MANEFITRNGLISLDSSQITGSLSVSRGITGSLQGTASWSSNAIQAATASSADDFLVRGTITAQTLVVQTVTSSIVYSSGSNIFGNSLANTQAMTGSVTITGSLNVNSNPVVTANQTSSTMFVQGGNSFGAQALLGTNDNQNLALETNGSIRMTVTNAGNVGIGTASPSAILDVVQTLASGAWTRIISRDSVSSAAFIGVYRNSNTYSAGVFAHNSALNAWEDLWINAHNDGSGGMAGGTAKRVLIGGTVGIGTASPTEMLHVTGNGRFNGYVSFNNQGYIRGGTNTLDLQGGTTGTYFYNSSYSAVRMVVLDGGSVGIGLTSITSGTRLEVAGDISIRSGTNAYVQTTDANNLIFRADQQAGTAGRGIYLQYWNASAWQNGLYVTNVASGFSNLIMMPSGGNVGIGTTSPSAALDVRINSGILVGVNSRAFIRQTVGGDAEIGAPAGGDLYLFNRGVAALSFNSIGAATFASSISAVGANFLSRTTVQVNPSDSSYTTAGFEVFTNGVRGPRISMHWGGVVASQIGIESDGTIVILNNPGNAYEKFKAGAITATSTLSVAGAATFSSSIAATSAAFSGRVNTSIGADIIVGGTSAPFSPSSVRGNMHIAGSGDRVLSFGPAGNFDAYIYSSSGISQLVSVPSIQLVSGGLNRFQINSGNGSIETTASDNSGNRTNPFNALTVTTTNNSLPFNGFGTGIVFASTHYDSLVYNGARIRSVLNDNSVVSLGNSIAFDVTATRGGTLNEAVRINYNGNVGIGTTSPLARLSVDAGAASSTAPTALFAQSATSQVYANIAGGDAFHGVIFRGYPAAAGDYSVVAGDFTSFYEWGGEFRFYRKTSSVLLENVRIVNTGLRLYNANNSNAGAILCTSNQGTAFAEISIVGGSGNGLIVTNDGIVGALTTSTSATPSGINGLWMMYNSGMGIIRAINQDVAFRDLMLDGLTLQFRTSNVERMRITNNGLVGIGTTAPNSRLDILGAAAVTTLRSSTTGNANEYYHSTNTRFGIIGNASQLVSGGSSGDFGILYDGNMIFASGVTSERMRITSAGNVGIGTTSPLAKLHIENGSTFYRNTGAGASAYTAYIGSISPNNNGDRYLHVRINTIGSMMYWIKIFGYNYLVGLVEGMAGGYVSGGTGSLTSGYVNGSIVEQYQNGGFLEIVIDTVSAATSNRWGSITFLGGTDSITTLQPLEIVAFSFTSSITRVY